MLDESIMEDKIKKDDLKIEESEAKYIKDFIRDSFSFIYGEDSETPKEILDLFQIAEEGNDVYYISMENTGKPCTADVYMSREDYISSTSDRAISNLQISNTDNRKTIDLSNQPDGIYCFTASFRDGNFYPIKCIKKEVIKYEKDFLS